MSKNRSYAQRFLLWASVLGGALGTGLSVGCGTTIATPSVARLAEMSAKPAAQTSAETPQLSQSPQQTQPPQVAPLRYTVRKNAGRKTVTSPIPRVLLSASHAKLCLSGVGDAFPALNLPLLGGERTELATLRGKQATVVLFWHPDRWMARTALIDMQRDIANQFSAEQVAVVGIAVRQPMGAVQAALNTAKATFPQLIDTDGQAFATIGTEALPRLYVLDVDGKIVWFDIEYSEGTRRELWQTLGVLTQP